MKKIENLHFIITLFAVSIIFLSLVSGMVVGDTRYLQDGKKFWKYICDSKKCETTKEVCDSKAKCKPTSTKPPRFQFGSSIRDDVGGYSVRFSPTKGAVYVKDINFKNVVEFKCDGQRCSPTGKVCNSRYTICDEPSSKNKKKLPGPFDQSLNTVRGHKVVSPSNNDADMQAARINSPPKVPEGQELYERKSGYRPTRTFYFLCDKEGTCNSYNDPCTCEIMEGYLSTDKNGKTTSHSDSARDIGKILDLPYVGPKSDFLSDTFVVLSKSRNYAIATLKACCPKPPATTC